MRWKCVVVDYSVYLVVRIAICLLQALSLATGEQLARLMAWLFGDVLHVRDAVLDENLSHAFPELSPAQRRRLIHRMWNHLFLLVLEMAHAPRKIHETNWRRYVRLRDEQVLMRLLLEGRPTLLTSAHFGNFELGNYTLGILGFPTHAIARTLNNPYLDRFVNRFRGATGEYIIPKNGGYEQIVDVLGRGGAMVALVDQYAGPKGCWVEFFGRPASAHKAIALLCFEHDAPVVVSYARRRRPLHFELGTCAVADPRAGGPEVASVRDLTQWYTRRLEEIIRTAPEQFGGSIATGRTPVPPTGKHERPRDSLNLAAGFIPRGINPAAKFNSPLATPHTRTTFVPLSLRIKCLISSAQRGQHLRHGQARGGHQLVDAHRLVGEGLQDLPLDFVQQQFRGPMDAGPGGLGKQLRPAGQALPARRRAIAPAAPVADQAVAAPGGAAVDAAWDGKHLRANYISCRIATDQGTRCLKTRGKTT